MTSPTQQRLRLSGGTELSFITAGEAPPYLRSGLCRARRGQGLR